MPTENEIKRDFEGFLYNMGFFDEDNELYQEKEKSIEQMILNLSDEDFSSELYEFCEMFTNRYDFESTEEEMVNFLDSCMEENLIEKFIETFVKEYT